MSPNGQDPPPSPRFTTGPLRWRAAVPQHRSPGGSRIGSALAALVLLVVVVAAGGLVVGTELNDDRRFREFVASGPVGEPVSAHTVDLTVLGARTAATIVEEPGFIPRDTAGVWVLVRIRALAQREPVSIGYAAVRDSAGREWSATERVEQPLVGFGYQLEPGIPVEAEVVFEVPREVATDLTVRLGDAGVDLRMQTVAEVPVPVDEAAVAAGLAATEPLVLADPELVIADPQVLVGTEGNGR
ncbi:MAG: hypothetical protein GEV12_10800 [Micromonosporaceae bacterium]|nr:hypothetical protein [Micromonosporaceae bacterium]